MTTLNTRGARAVPPKTEADRIYSKISWRLIPFLCVLWVLAWLDRVNIGFAKLQMLNDLHFSEAVYGLGAGIFFLGYFLFEVPSNILLDRIGARKTIARITIGWGIVSILMLFTTTPTQFYVLRFLLGVFEAGFYPGIILYLTYWYPSERRSRAFGLFMSASAIAGIIGGPLAGIIMTSLNDFHGMRGWQWLFLIEGIPSVLAGLVTLAYLTDKPSQAKWLSEDERAFVQRELQRDAAACGPREHSFLASLRKPKLWALVAIFFCIIAANSTLTFWAPSIVRDMGVSDSLHVGLLIGVAYIFGACGMVSNGYFADKTGKNTLHVAGAALLGASAMAATAMLAHQPVLAFIALTLAVMGTMSAIPVFWQLPNLYVSGAAAAAGVAMINSFANLAGFGAPYAMGVLKDAGGGLSSGLLAVAMIEAFGALLVLLLIRPQKPLGSQLKTAQ
ncbi:MFS transporter [Noviherbaspirillum denitrificans]|uniref:MFS transporter n=1 Tax=Noviherbaspirillum denitrificans TaxID=1968433 RepID=A0A254TF72_9BURK|nr:MFS transporter [Noviherbaspirillum denitrificans]OWW21264.1 MFS transporter [Noviherbaspirillum denitrificans]